MDLDFLKELGEELKDTDIESVEQMEEALRARVAELEFDVDDLDIEYDKGIATIQGMAADEDTMEKVLLAVGNVKGVVKVKNEMVVGLTEAEKEEMRKAASERVAARVAELKAEKDREDLTDTYEAMKAKLEAEQRRKAFKRAYEERMKRMQESRTVFYTVVRGDSLRKIAGEHYGDQSRWPEIFEANQPMIKDANLIYPGQVLRIPGAKG